MPTILAFDTSLGECSVALWCNGKLAAEETETTRNRQTERLVPMIEAVLSHAECDLQSISQFVTTAGPGSFTGIRIGLAVARGFTLATNAPTLAISTLELLAWQAAHASSDSSQTIYGAFINAYRGEIYMQIFQKNTKMQPLTEAIACTTETAQHLIAKYEGMQFAGDAAAIVTGTAAHAHAVLPSAAALAEYAGLHALNPAQYLPQPLYIRAPDAKIQEAYLLASQQL